MVLKCSRCRTARKKFPAHDSSRIKIQRRIRRRRICRPCRLRFQSKIGAAGRQSHRISPATCADISRSTQGIDIRRRQGARPLPSTVLQRSSFLFPRQWLQDRETPAEMRGTVPAIVDDRESVARPYQAATAEARSVSHPSVVSPSAPRHRIPISCPGMNQERPPLQETKPFGRLEAPVHQESLVVRNRLSPAPTPPTTR